MPKKITQNVNKDKLLNDLPEVHPQKSTWKNRHTNYQSSFLGDIVPIYFEEILPDEEKEVHLGMISHTQTPVAPIFNSLYTEIRSFFIPLRLCADLLNGYKNRKSPWVKVFGEDNFNSTGRVVVPLSDQKLPLVGNSFMNKVNAYLTNSSKKDDNIFDSLDISQLPSNLDFNNYNFLQLAAYELIYQRHYRNENYESATDSPLYKMLFDAYGSTNTPNLPISFTFEKANKEKDYYTGAKPFTLKASSPVTVGLAGEATVAVKNNGSSTITSGYQLDINETITAGNTGQGDFIASGSGAAVAAGLVADLSTASGITIEQLRILIKTQELLEKDAMYGSLYAESLNSHFGCCPLDLTLQDPQELFKTTITSNMQAIFQTSSTNGESSILGTIGANSTTQTDPFIIVPKTKFYEHGILMICAVHKLQNVYDTRKFKPKFLFKRNRFDFYTPELNDLGFMPIDKKETGMSASDISGYNEAYAEYRFTFNKSHGSLNTQFPYWAPAISNEFGSIAAMYKEGSGILDKSLSVRSNTAPQFFDAWGFEEINTKPMSLHSIPGMDGVI